MKNKRLLTAVICAVTAISLSVIPLSPLSFLSTAKVSAASKAPNPKKLSCDSAIVMELSTGTVLYSKNIHKQHYPASITKIMTTMLAIENSSLDETVTFSKAAAYGISYDASSISAKPGEKLSMKNCLYAMMLRSANEVCLAVAEHVSGTQSAFIKLMNKKVASLGLKDTHFSNPNGLHNPKHYTSAYDMARIAQAAFQSETFQKVTSTKSYTIPKTNKSKSRLLYNHHQMLYGYEEPQYEYKYCIGGKTGYTDEARSTLVTYAQKNGMQLVSVVMYANSGLGGAPNEYTDSTNILNYAFENYKKHTISNATTNVSEDLFTDFSTYFNEDSSPLKLSNDISVVLPKGVSLSKTKKKITYDKSVKLVKGQNTIGKVSYTYNGKTVGSADILYNYDDATESTLDEASRKLVATEITQINTSTHSNPVVKFFNNAKFKSINTFGNIINFLKNRSLLIFLMILIAAVILLMIISHRETVNNRGRRRFTSRESNKNRSVSKSPKSDLHFSKHRHRSSDSASRSSTNMSTGSLSFGKKRRHKTKHSMMDAVSSFSLGSVTPSTGKRHSQKKSKSGILGSSISSGNKAISTTETKRRKGKHSTDNLSSKKKKETPENTRPAYSSKKAQKRHKNTHETFGKNFYDFK